MSTATNFFESENVTLVFNSFEDDLNLPFPLNLNKGWTIVITLQQILTLVFGIKLRSIIILYLLSPDTKLGPINSLIWMDQINGIFLAFAIALRMMAINSPIPLSQVFGDSFCEWIGLPGCIYICGAVVWSCFIAIYR